MASAFANFQQKMNSLRIEADENAAKAEELKSKVKTLEQENLQKEQEITSLTHRNGLLEGEVEKLETAIKEAKTAAGEASEHSTANENLQRKLQVLEEEAEAADKTLRETNEKYDRLPLTIELYSHSLQAPSDRRQSRPLRAKSPSLGTSPRRVGGQIRRNGEEARRPPKGVARTGAEHGKYLIGLRHTVVLVV